MRASAWTVVTFGMSYLYDLPLVWKELNLFTLTVLMFFYIFPFIALLRRDLHPLGILGQERESKQLPK